MSDELSTCRFTGLNGSKYICSDDRISCETDSGLLNSLFKAHGYCVNPMSRNGKPLSSENINELKNLAYQNKDNMLLSTIQSIENNKIPSPRMFNDGLMYETTMNEKYRYNELSTNDKNNICSVLKIILNIGLYIAGWKGPSDTYLSSIAPLSDLVRVEMQISPLVHNLHKDQHYPMVKNFPIIRYRLTKPYIVDESLNVDKCLNKISLGITDEYQELSVHLISTAYYYITKICDTPLPMIQPLIESFV